MKLLSKAFWVYSYERALKTGAQTAMSLLTVDYTGILEVDYVQVGSAAGLAALMSILTSLTKFEESYPDREAGSSVAEDVLAEIERDAQEALDDLPIEDPDATREIPRHRA